MKVLATPHQISKLFFLKGFERFLIVTKSYGKDSEFIDSGHNDGHDHDLRAKNAI